MKKRILIAVAFCIGTAFFFKPVDVNAANMKETFATISEAQNTLAQAKADLANAQAKQSDLWNKYNWVKNNGGSDYDVQKAYDEYNNQCNIVHWYNDQVNVAANYINQCSTSQILTSAQQVKLYEIHGNDSLREVQDQVKGAIDAANGALAQYNLVLAQIAQYKAQVATCPEFQVQINQLTAMLPGLQADYVAKKAYADQKQAQLNLYVAQLQQQGYLVNLVDNAKASGTNVKVYGDNPQNNYSGDFVP